MCCGGCTGLLKREREGHRRRGKSTVHETQSRAIFHRRAQKRECARGFLHPRCVGRAREKGPFFHSVHHQSLPLGPPSLSDAPLVRQRSSAQEEFANPLLEENPLLFSFSPPLPKPASQPANKYTMLFLLPGIGGGCGCQAGLSQLPSSHNIQQFFSLLESFSTLFFL